jgi:hypothetical protein
VILSFLVLGIPLAVSAPPEVPASNLVKNGSFAADLTGWKVSPDDPNSETGAVSWSRDDAGGSPASGSLEVVTSATADRNAFRAGQCIRVGSRAENLVFGGRIRVPADQKPRGLASLEIERYESTDCSGRAVPFDSLGGITNADFWSSRRELVATAGARSVRMVAAVVKYYEWDESDEIGEADDDVPFRAWFDDLYLTPVGKDSPGPRPPLPADATRFNAAPASAKKQRWGPHLVDPPKLSIAVIGPDLKPHKAEVTPECSSLDALQIDVALKNPYAEDDPRFYPLQAVSLAGDGDLGPRPTIELGLFKAGDKERKLVPIACEGGPSIGVRVIGDRGQRVAGLREFYDCFRGSLDEEKRKAMAEKLSDDEMLGWPLARWVVANPAGEYEVVARYHAREAGFWHEPVLSNTVKVKIVRKEPCAK